MDTKQGEMKTSTLDWVAEYTIDPELKRLVLLQKARIAAEQRLGSRETWRTRVTFTIEREPIQPWGILTKKALSLLFEIDY